MRLGHSEKGRKGVYGLGSLWRIVWCMVIGVIGKPHEIKGESIKAFVILKKGVEPTEHL